LKTKKKTRSASLFGLKSGQTGSDVDVGFAVKTTTGAGIEVVVVDARNVVVGGGRIGVGVGVRGEQSVRGGGAGGACTETLGTVAGRNIAPNIGRIAGEIFRGFRKVV
jgi:hypothetical protein